MSEELITVLAGGVLAVIGSFAGNYAISLKKSHEDAIKDAEREQSQKDQLRAILDEQKKVRKRLDSHNGYAEKFAETTKDIALLKQQQAYILKSVENLQKDIDYLKSNRCKV